MMSSSASAPTSTSPSWWICPEQRPSSGERSVRERLMPGVGMRRPDGICVCEPHAEVRLFEQQPSAWTEPRDHSPEDFGVVGDVHENSARVDEVERSLRERVGAEVVAEYFDIGSLDRVEEIDLEVGRSHVPARPDALGEPTRDRPAAAADLQACCSRLRRRAARPACTVSGSRRCWNRARGGATRPRLNEERRNRELRS